MTSKHTPGPWEANEYSSPRGRWFIRQIGGLENINYPLNEANARLIAAAPDSHNANVLFIEAIDCLYNITLAWTDDRIYDELPSSGLALAYFSARSAIANATGAQS